MPKPTMRLTSISESNLATLLGEADDWDKNGELPEGSKLKGLAGALEMSTGMSASEAVTATVEMVRKTASDRWLNGEVLKCPLSRDPIKMASSNPKWTRKTQLLGRIARPGWFKIKTERLT